MNMKLPELSLEIWEQNYKGPEDTCVEDTWKRQAKACASVEKEELREKAYNAFLWLLTDFKGIAGGRITANLGVGGREAVSLFNCFVHNPADINYKDPDSIEGIYDMLKVQAHTLKSEGGYGMSFSWIRPNGHFVEGIDGRTPGVLKFMELWDKSSEIITMGAENIIGEKRTTEKKRIRKGAMMGVLSCTHPEIEAFIDAKLIPNRLTKFNISVGITEGFMDAVINDRDWNLIFPDTKYPKYKTEWGGDIQDWQNKGYPVTIFKTIKATTLWDKIMHATYTRNDPGVMFLDVANKLNPLYYAETIRTSNPCGEILMGTGVCNLFSLNLVKYFKNNKFDFVEFKKAVAIAVRFSDNINDISRTPNDAYKKSMVEKRRLGIGVLGLGSVLYMLGIRYGSEESLELIDQIFKAKCETELLTSAKLGKEKGSFLLFDKEKYFSSYWWKTLPISDAIKNEIEAIGEMRNSHHSANAPTGNMSVYAGCVSGGIEPVFLKEYIRWVIVSEPVRYELRKDGFKFPDVNKGEWFETEHMKFSKSFSKEPISEEVLRGSFGGNIYQVDKNRGLTKQNNVKDYGWRFCDNIDGPQNPDVFVTTDDLSVDDHINVLKTIAKYVNMNSSKTVNLPNDYPYKDFKDLYLKAWRNNIKGITSYRADTMTAVLEKMDKEVMVPESNERTVGPRPHVLKSETFKTKVDTGAGELKNAYVTVSFFENTKNPYEIFLHFPVGVGEGFAKDVQISEGCCRLASLCLRHGVPARFVAEQLEKIDSQYLFSIPTTIAGILDNYTEKEKGVDIEIIKQDNTEKTFEIIKTAFTCNHKNSVKQEGCVLCLSCGWSACS